MTGIRIDVDAPEELQAAIAQLVTEHTKKVKKERRRGGVKLLGMAIMMILAVTYAFWIWFQAQGRTFFPTQDHVAVIPISGTIGGAGPSQQPENINAMVERAFNNSSTKAVILHIDSGGGRPAVADRVGRFARMAADQANKPLIAHIDGVGASAAYMIASWADEIHMSQYSLTGSIGSMMAGLNWAELADRAGIEQHVLVSSPLKNAMSPWTDMEPRSRALLQGLVDRSAEAFAEQVVSARGDRLKTDLEELAKAKIYLAPQALELGLIDGISSLDELTQNMLGLPIYRLEHRRNLYEQLLVTTLGQVETFFSNRSGLQ